MKKILFGFLLSITAASFVSCDMNDPNDGKFGVDSKSGWVEFTQPYEEIMTDTTVYAGCNIAIPLTLSAPVNTDGVEVFYTITDVIGSSANLETHASIPAGSRTGSFMVTNTEGITSPIEFLVTLTSTNKQNVRIGYPDTGDQTMTVRINPNTRDSYIGTYAVTETSSDGLFEYDSDITAGTAANELRVSNIFDQSSASQTRIFVNPDGTLSFPAFTDNVLIPGVFVEGISGTADLCSGRVIINFNLKNAGGTVLAGPVKVVLER